MDSKKPKRESSTTTRDVARDFPPIVQEHPEDAPAGWAAVQEGLAAKLGLSVLLVDGRQPPALVASNNNSICHAFQSSLDYVGLCDPYCGDAHRRALSAGSSVQYKCHAGLQCFTMPAPVAGEQRLVAIGGRAFVSGADYRKLVDRFRAGELNDLLASEPFENVIFAESERLDQLAEKLHRAIKTFGQSADTLKGQPPVIESGAVITADELTLPATESSEPVDEPIDTGIFSIESDPDRRADFKRLRKRVPSLNLADTLERLSDRINLPDPVETYKAILGAVKELLRAERASLMTFDEATNELVLKESEGLERAEGEVTKIKLGEDIAGEVLQSGKAVVTENLELAGYLVAASDRKYKTKSFISFPLITKQGRKLGVLNVADKVDGGKFDAVDLNMLEIIGPRIVAAVDRAALSLERNEWQERAAQFQLMSITDPLTGLLNRRYLEERLTDELNRSQRYSYSASCLMIDIDDFKRYNDRNGHQAGDVALKITAHALKSALRSADVACRYGGEEFCILLPQTTLSEAGVIAERMRQKVAQKEYPFGKSQPMGTVTISIGVSTFARNIDTGEKMIAAADRALYDAKAKGKNRVEFYLDNVTNPPRP
jgi:diguanylate cyclase (GGDEF)-like protein